MFFALYEGSHRFLPLENHSLCRLDMDYFDNILFSMPLKEDGNLSLGMK